MSILHPLRSYLPPDSVPQQIVVRTDFDVTEALPEPVVSAAPAVTPRVPLHGSFAGIRAAQVAYLYAIEYWKRMPGYVAGTPITSDYTAKELEEKYSDFVLYNYLPPAMTPTKEEFAGLVQPSQLASVLTTVLDAPVPVEDTAQSGIIEALPFADEISSMCARLQ